MKSKAPLILLPVPIVKVMLFIGVAMLLVGSVFSFTLPAIVIYAGLLGLVLAVLLAVLERVPNRSIAQICWLTCLLGAGLEFNHLGGNLSWSSHLQTIGILVTGLATGILAGSRLHLLHLPGGNVGGEASREGTDADRASK